MASSSGEQPCAPVSDVPSNFDVAALDRRSGQDEGTFWCSRVARAAVARLQAALSAKPRRLVALTASTLLVDLPFSIVSATACGGGAAALGLPGAAAGVDRYFFGGAGFDLLLVSAVRLCYIALCCGLHAVSDRLVTPQQGLCCKAATGSDNGKGVRKLRWTDLAVWSGRITSLYLAAKVLARMMDGGGPPGYGMGTTWFWIGAVGTLLLAAAQSALVPLAGRMLLPCPAVLTVDDQEQLEHGSSEGATQAQPGYKTTAADLLLLFRPDLLLLAAGAVTLITAAVAQVLLPHYVGLMLAGVMAEQPAAALRSAATSLIITALVCAVASGGRSTTFTVVTARVNVRLRRILFGSLLRQEMGFFDATLSGEIGSTLASDCTMVGETLCLNWNIFSRNLVLAIGTLMVMTFLSWKLSLVAFISVPATVGISKWYGAYLRDLTKMVQQRLAEANSVAEETLGSMKTVRSFGAEANEQALYASRLRHYYVLYLKEAGVYGGYSSITTLLPQLVTVMVLYYGGRLYVDGELKFSSFVSFMLYLSSLSDAFTNMSSMFTPIAQTAGAMDKVFELIQRQPREHHPGESGAEALTPPRGTNAHGQVELRGVHFTYPSRPDRVVLRNVTLNVPAGKTLALVGPSGGGKSSCAALIKALYRPTEGMVLLDGHPVEDYDWRWFHRTVSIVGQEPVLYARTIEQNILYALEGEVDEPSHNEVVAAAKLANAHDFVQSLPLGYDTPVGHRGLQLSGGQKQRIAIARALVRKPKVLLLDEATSALDAESEAMVQDAIDNMMHSGKMTVIVIAHRLSTIRGADSVAVIKEGQVVEQGSHEELLAAGGVFTSLVSRQLGLIT